MNHDTDLTILAEQIISAQCSYDTAEHKQALIEAFLAGVTAQKNNEKKYVAVVEPYEGGSAYIRGWRAALGEVFKLLKSPDFVTIISPTAIGVLQDTINALSENIEITR